MVACACLLQRTLPRGPCLQNLGAKPTRRSSRSRAESGVTPTSPIAAPPPSGTSGGSRGPSPKREPATVPAPSPVAPRARSSTAAEYRSREGRDHARWTHHSPLPPHHSPPHYPSPTAIAAAAPPLPPVFSPAATRRCWFRHSPRAPLQHNTTCRKEPDIPAARSQCPIQ